MLKTMMKHSLSVVVCLLSAFAAVAKDETRKDSTEVTINGEKAMVYFNDGDTFKVLDGSLKQSRVRVIGINTLESYGPVHQWANSSTAYLFEMANLATQMAQVGPWNCTTEKDKDVYGRLLATCDDLALALISAGVAHAYSIDSEPAKRSYLAKQRLAQRARAGVWKNGVPDFIITSLHSADEGSAEPYNRLISTQDGHTRKWNHRDNYATCETVCLDDDKSCMVYVPFGQRYGSRRPDCLLGK